MDSQHGLQQIEHRSWQRVFEDGIWDIAIGLTLLTFGVSILTDFAPSAAIIVAVLIPSLRQFKRKLTEPRIGRVRFAPHRKRQIGRIPILLAGLVVAGLAFFAILTWSLQSEPPAWLQVIRTHFVLIIGLIWGGALSLAGLFLGCRRLHLYALVLLGSLIAVDLAEGFHLGWALVGVGGVIALVGVLLLLCFTSRYPRIEDEESGDRLG